MGPLAFALASVALETEHVLPVGADAPAVLILRPALATGGADVAVGSGRTTALGWGHGLTSYWRLSPGTVTGQVLRTFFAEKAKGSTKASGFNLQASGFRRPRRTRSVRPPADGPEIKPLRFSPDGLTSCGVAFRRRPGPWLAG